MSEVDEDILQIFSKQSFTTQTFCHMNQLCTPTLNNLGISVFEYARVYDDGTACVLYSNPDIAHYVINKQIHISAHVPKQIIDTEFWFMPDPNGQYSLAIGEIKNLFNSSSFANYIRRHNGFYEMYSFWREDDQALASNKFMNMKESLEQYSLNFVDRAKDLIIAADRDRFKLTEPMLPNFQGLNPNKKINTIKLNFYLEKVRDELTKLNAYIYPKLSVQELKCIYFLVEGKTVIDIAELLKLSHRTVEMHLNSVKLKLNCQKKSDIVGALIILEKKISSS